MMMQIFHVSKQEMYDIGNYWDIYHNKTIQFCAECLTEHMLTDI